MSSNDASTNGNRRPNIEAFKTHTVKYLKSPPNEGLIFYLDAYIRFFFKSCLYLKFLKNHAYVRNFLKIMINLPQDENDIRYI